MDYHKHLCKPLSKLYIDKLVQTVFNYPADFPTVYNIVFDNDLNVAWRAAWACQKISEKHPEWFTEEQFLQLISLSLTTSHKGLQRGCLSTINNLQFPKDISVEFINACFDWMISTKSSVSAQALSMKILVKICQIEPDLKQEMITYLENLNFQDYSPGFNSTRRHALNTLINSKK